MSQDNSDAITQQLAECQEREKRALADYQNLLRRSQQERLDSAKYGSQQLVQKIIQPLEHLSLASSQLQDPGLQMVIDQFWQVLHDEGLEEINPLHQEFDISTMEAVEQAEEGTLVTEVRRKGYKFKDRVLQFAQVVVGTSSK